MKQFQNKKVVSAVLAVTMAVTGIQVPVLAAENHTENTDKEEVVYVNLNHDGTVKEINVVNILKPDSTGAVVDYGDFLCRRLLYGAGGADDYPRSHSGAHSFRIWRRSDSFWYYLRHGGSGFLHYAALWP